MCLLSFGLKSKSKIFGSSAPAEFYHFFLFLINIKADLPVDDSIGLTYGMCVPDRCQKEDVARMVSNCKLNQKEKTKLFFYLLNV
jgi:hypothetical protein